MARLRTQDDQGADSPGPLDMLQGAPAATQNRTPLQGDQRDPFGPGPIDESAGLGREGETPREREGLHSQLRQLGGGGEPGAQATPARPRSPQPMAGSVSPGSTEGILPFTPMGSPDVGSMATPRGASLFGGATGQKGGGLGVPMDPLSNQLSDPISLLLKQIMGGGGGY